MTVAGAPPCSTLSYSREAYRLTEGSYGINTDQGDSSLLAKNDSSERNHCSTLSSSREANRLTEGSHGINTAKGILQSLALLQNDRCGPGLARVIVFESFMQLSFSREGL